MGYKATGARPPPPRYLPAIGFAFIGRGITNKILHDTKASRTEFLDWLAKK